MKSFKSWFRRLSVRLAIMSASVIVGAMLLFTYLVAEQEANTLSVELKKQAVALTSNLAASAASYIVVNDYTTLENMLIRAAQFPSITELQVMSDEGAMLGDVFRNSQGEIETRFGEKINPPIGEPAPRITVHKDSMTAWQPVILGDLVGWVRINYTLDRIVEIRAQAWNYNLFVGILVAIVTVGILFIYLRRPVSLIEKSAEFADALDTHAGQQIVENKSYYEIHKLTSALNRTSRSLQEKNEALTKKIIGQEQVTEKLEQMVQKRTEELSAVRDEAIQANNSKSQFLANMSHEIRTPLTAIIGFSEILLDSDQSTSERIESAKRVNRAGKHLFRVINEILDLSKIEANKLDVELIPVSLVEIFRDVYSFVKLTAEEKGLSISIECDLPVPETVITDPVRFKQILINLCNNAVKFTKRGSVSIKVSYDAGEENLFIRVIDTGIGLSQQQIERLFKPFSQADASTTRNFGGTGLGLYLSKQLAEKLGGSLSVESVVDVGSSFNLLIKAGTLQDVSWLNEKPDFESLDDDVEILSQQPSLSGRVLLAEDNIDNQQLVSLYLRRLGVECDIANNGKEAIEKFRTFSPDLIVMDMQMPIMDGLAATRKLRAINCQLPIVALTANAMQHEQQQCFDAGCNEVCTKPIEYNNFLLVLSRHLQSGTKQKNITPIVSSLWDEDAEIRDVLKGFVVRLPDMVSEIIASYADNDIDKLKIQLHTLKGAGGNCGYSDIYDIIKRLEFDLLAENHPAIIHSLEILMNIQNRVVSGLNNNTESNIRPFKKND